MTQRKSKYHISKQTTCLCIHTLQQCDDTEVKEQRKELKHVEKTQKYQSTREHKHKIKKTINSMRSLTKYDAWDVPCQRVILQWLHGCWSCN